MEKQDSKITRWHAELYIGKSKTPDALFSSISKDLAISNIILYVHTMVEPEEPFKIVVKKNEIKLVPKLKTTKG